MPLQSHSNRHELIDIRRMTGVLGAEITGLRLADADAQSIEAVRDATLRHRVVAVRDQFLNIEDQLRFCSQLGEFTYTRSLIHNSEHPEVYTVENPGKSGVHTDNWHTDGTTSANPPSFTILAAQVIPDVGGDTIFADMVHAYEALSERYRQLLRGLRGRHINRLFDPVNPPQHSHPLVRGISETGERALYAGFPGIISEIEGMTAAESKPILDFLFQHSLNPDGLYRHRWMAGDVVMWDNRTTMHYAVHDYGDARRTMTRLMIKGEEPTDFAYED